VLQCYSGCVCVVETFKAKQGFGYVKSDEIREVTPTRQNCDQTQWRERNTKSGISANVRVFNRRYVMQFPKVALDYVVDLSRYCRTRKFSSYLRYLETYSHSVQNTYILYVAPKFTDCFVFHVGHLPVSNYVLWGYSVRQRSYKQNAFIFRM
jgi:hypothetical protein